MIPKINKINKINLTKQDKNNVSSKNFNLAISALSSESYIQYEETEFWLEAPKQENIEKEYIKRKLFKKLTKETQEVLEVVFNCPQELLEFAITPIKKRWSYKGVQKYICNKFGKRKSKAILNEIHNFLLGQIQNE